MMSRELYLRKNIYIKKKKQHRVKKGQKEGKLSSNIYEKGKINNVELKR